MDIENLLNAETIMEFLMNEDYQSELEADYEDVADLHIPEAGQFASVKSIKILLQFLFSMVSYYENLPECLKQCYWEEPREGSEQECFQVSTKRTFAHIKAVRVIPRFSFESIL